MDINVMLTELIHTYCVDELMPNFYPCSKAIGIAKELYEQFEKVVIVGTKQTDLLWFQTNICDKSDESLLFSEENPDKDLLKYKRQGFMFLVVSYYGRDEVMVRLLACDCQAVCLYDIFEKNHLFFRGDFYDIYGEEYIKKNSGDLSRDFNDFDINKIFFYHRRRYELATTLEDRKTALKKMIFDSVYAKDFLTLKKYIAIFSEQSSLEEGERYFLFYSEIEKLLLLIKDALRNRNKEDCIIFWLDALEYGEDMDMPFLREVNDSALVFSDMYTVMPWTRPTFKAMFAKKRIIEEESWKIGKIGKENSSLICGLKQRNYKFLYYGPTDFTEQECTAKHLYGYGSSATQIYWDAISDILMNDEETFFCVLHELLHTHSPYISMGLQGDQYDCRLSRMAVWRPDEKLAVKQMAESRKWIDEQLAFWGGLLPEEMFKIYLSDHGHTFFEKHHCILKIQQKYLKPGVCKELFSWYDFDRLIFAVLDSGSVDESRVDNRFCMIQSVEYYDKDSILAYLNKLRRKEISSSPVFLPGYQGVVTREEMFIHYNNGIEFYQKKQNDGCMVTDERLDYLRGITSKKCVDIAKEEKFKYSYLAYQVTQRCKERTKVQQEKKKDIIKRIFEQTEDGKVLALRGGGMHSLYLMMLLEEKLRKKVSYVIDKDPECFAGKLGIKVITVEQAAVLPLDKVLLSSFEYRQEWKEECQQKLQAEVIDPYELLEQQGIYCREEFYHLEYEKEDFDGIVP